jgi:hypothetical protein
MSSGSASTTEDGRALESPAGVFSSVLSAAVGFAAGKLERKVVAWTDKLQGVVEGGDASAGLASLADAGLDELAAAGAADKAGAEGIKAGLHGKNPIWAAIKASWQSGPPAVRAAIITAAASAILLLLVSPVLFLVFLVSLLIFAAVHRAQAANT